MAEVILKNVKKSFGKVEVLHDINLEINSNEFTVFVGPSGCGKSTLLRLISGLEDVTAGEVFIDQECVNTKPPAKRGIAMVFQSYALYPHMTVYQNIAFGLHRSQYSKEEIRRRVLEAAKILQVEQYLERKPKQLSGGQRQRIAIGRAIVKDPKVFLFDEPLSNLDANLRVKMRMEIANLKRKLKTTMVYVTHDQVEAMTLADKIVVLRNGCIEQVGTPLELYHHPCNKFVAGFIGLPKINFFEAFVTKLARQEINIELPSKKIVSVPIGSSKNFKDIHIGSKVLVGIRSEHIKTTRPEDADFIGRVNVVEHLGSETYLYASGSRGVTLLVRVEGDNPLEVGDAVYLNFDKTRFHLFDPSTQEALF